MATNNENNARRPAPRRRRRRPGVPVMLTVVLLILALLLGGLGGFALARKTDTHIHELQAAKDRITELENTLTLIGYPVGEDVDPQQWLYDAAESANALEALSGDDWSEEADDVWQDDTLLSGTLPDAAEPVVVAEFDGGTLLSSEVVPAYNGRLTDRIFAGENGDAVAEETLNAVMAELVTDKLIAAQAEKMGLTTLTDADQKEIDEEAARRYETQLDDYIAFAMDGSGDRDAAARNLADESGVTLESVTEALKRDFWRRKYYDATVATVAVGEEAARARYDELLADQRQRFAANPEAFENAHLSGDVIVYRPEGYRAVRDVLIALSPADADTAARLTDQIEQGTAEEGAQGKLDALYAPLEATAKAVEEKLAGGTAFADLMNEYGCSAALNTDALRKEGFYIREGSYVNSTEFVEGGMMLEAPGQVTSPLRSAYGVHLVEYVGDVTPGDVPFEEVADAVTADALKLAQAAEYKRVCERLLKEANVKYYPERLH